MRGSSSSSPFEGLPMLWVLLPLLLGISTAGVVAVPLWASLSLFVLLLSLFLWRLDIWILYPVIFSFALIITSFDTPTDLGKLEGATTFAIKPVSGYRAEVLAYRGDFQSWTPSEAELLVSAKELNLPMDSVSVCRGSLYIFPNGGRTAQAKLFVDSVEGTVALADIGAKASLPARLHKWAVERVELLGLSDEVFSSVVAMALGDKTHLSSGVVESYRKSGTSHLLALSGMHIGIVFVIIRLLLYLLPLLRGGHIIADVLSIIFIWLFAAAAGLGDSVVRAASMFTLLQMSYIFSNNYESLNSLFAVAVVMLLFDCDALYDVGFQLSFIAVLAILLWAMPLCRLLRTHYRIVDWVTTSIIMGVAASVATAPIIAYRFGYVSLLSPVATMPLALTLFAIVAITLLWIIFGAGFMAPLFNEVLTTVVTVQNYIAEWFAGLFLLWFDYRFTLWEAVVCYLLFALLTIFYAVFVRPMSKSMSKLDEDYDYDYDDE